MAQQTGPGWCPFAIHKPLRNPNQRQRPRRVAKALGFCMHIQDGYGMLEGWYNNPNGSGPTHFQLMRTGDLYQFASTKRCVWANGGNGSAALGTPLSNLWGGQGLANDYTISCEYEEDYDPVRGIPRAPMTEAAVQKAARLLKWCREEEDWPQLVYAPTSIHQIPGGGAVFRHFHFINKACDANVWQEKRVIAMANDTSVPARPTLESLVMFWGPADHTPEMKWAWATAFMGVRWHYAANLANNIDRANTLTDDELAACVFSNTVRAVLGLPWDGSWD